MSRRIKPNRLRAWLWGIAADCFLGHYRPWLYCICKMADATDMRGGPRKTLEGRQ
ncbi:MAG: hypothetical protein ACRD2E_11520 [Terriglobales bacterium]